LQCLRFIVVSADQFGIAVRAALIAKSGRLISTIAAKAPRARSLEGLPERTLKDEDSCEGYGQLRYHFEEGARFISVLGKAV
jgi:hypothetical protein